MPSEDSVAKQPVQLPERFQDPTPVVGVLSLVWLLGLVVSIASGHWAGWGQACLAGLIVGVLGFVLFLRQRRAARRGDRTAQRGL